MSQAKLAGTWIVAVSRQGDFMKWGLDGDCKLPFPPTTKPEDIQKEAFSLATSETHRDDFFYVLEVFNTGETISYNFDVDEYAQINFIQLPTAEQRDPRPVFKKGTKYNKYSVEALEKFITRTTYEEVVARSEDEAKWLVRHGHESYSDPQIEEGGEEFYSIETVELIEKNVPKPVDE